MIANYFGVCVVPFDAKCSDTIVDYQHTNWNVLNRNEMRKRQHLTSHSHRKQHSISFAIAQQKSWEKTEQKQKSIRLKITSEVFEHFVLQQAHKTCLMKHSNARLILFSAFSLFSHIRSLNGGNGEGTNNLRASLIRLWICWRFISVNFSLVWDIFHFGDRKMCTLYDKKHLSSHPD